MEVPVPDMVRQARADGEQRGVSVMEVPVPDMVRQARADGEQIARWDPSSSVAGNRSRCPTHLGEAFFGRLIRRGGVQPYPTGAWKSKEKHL
jgi:hypothetical protein